MKDDQGEAKGKGVRMEWPGSPWKQSLTDVSGARWVAAPVPRTGQCRHDKGKNSQGKDPRTQEQKSGPAAGERA